MLVAYVLSLHDGDYHSDFFQSPDEASLNGTYLGDPAIKIETSQQEADPPASNYIEAAVDLETESVMNHKRTRHISSGVVSFSDEVRVPQSPSDSKGTKRNSYVDVESFKSCHTTVPFEHGVNGTVNGSPRRESLEMNRLRRVSNGHVISIQECGVDRGRGTRHFSNGQISNSQASFASHAILSNG